MFAGVTTKAIGGAQAIRVWSIAARGAHAIGIAASGAFMLFDKGHDEVHGVYIDTLGDNRAATIAA